MLINNITYEREVFILKKKARRISIFASIIAGSLAVIHVVNKIIFFLSTMKESLYKTNQQYYNWRFGKICYTKSGSGTPLLLVHDLSSTGSNYEFKELERRLSKEYTVYSIDLLGCGQSDKPKITYTNYLYVQLLSDFIKTIIQEKTTIIASRKSCSIAVMNSYIDSSMIEKLVLINPSDLRDLNKCPGKKHKALKCCYDLPIIGTFLYNLKTCRRQISKQFSTDYLYEAKPVTRYETAFMEAAHTSGSASKYLYTSIRCHYTNTNILHALRAIQIPILVLEGSDVKNGDRITNEYESYSSNVESVVIVNTKGMPHIERPDSCYSIIEDFLS